MIAMMTQKFANLANLNSQENKMALVVTLEFKTAYLVSLVLINVMLVSLITSLLVQELVFLVVNQRLIVAIATLTLNSQTIMGTVVPINSKEFVQAVETILMSVKNVLKEN